MWPVFSFTNGTKVQYQTLSLFKYNFQLREWQITQAKGIMKLKAIELPDG